MTIEEADWPKPGIGWPGGVVTRDSPPWLAPHPPTPTLQLTMLSSLVQKSVLSTATRVSRLNARPILARAYHEKVISHYENPRNVSVSQPPRFPFRLESLSDNVPPQVGSLPKNDFDVGTGLVGAPAYVSPLQLAFIVAQLLIPVV